MEHNRTTKDIATADGASIGDNQLCGNPVGMYARSVMLANDEEVINVEVELLTT